MTSTLSFANYSPFTSRRLTLPAVPVTLPAEFTNLTALEALEIVGDGNSPVGLSLCLGERCANWTTLSRPVSGGL